MLIIHEHSTTPQEEPHNNMTSHNVSVWYFRLGLLLEQIMSKAKQRWNNI